jgi:ANTAR domain
MTRGPCLDCSRVGQPVAAPDLTAARQIWPQFAPAAHEAGFDAVQALPTRLRAQIISTLNLFQATPGAFSHQDLRIGQALANVATIALLQQRSTRPRRDPPRALQGALNSRVVIEQAKGKLAERAGLDTDQAFTVLRDHARARNLRWPTCPGPSSTAPPPRTSPASPPQLVPGQTSNAATP